MPSSTRGEVVSAKPDSAFACPECRAALQRSDSGYQCPACRESYPVIDDIAIFSSTDNYYGEIERPEMRQLLEDAQARGYRAALKDHIVDPFVYKYTADESRAQWISVIPHDRSSRFIEVGCGWGTNAVPIAREVREIVALDATYERVKFVQIRAAQDRAHNVVPVLGTAVRLPFPDGSFDVVSFNGVLEWLGAIDLDAEPSLIQKRALGEAYRVLRPGGHVYVGIENRYSLSYWLGKPDDHSFIRFTSLMPRAMADLYCRLRARGRYYTHTHSLRAYRTMFRECGFHDVSAYLPWPTYRNPDCIVPLEYEQIVDLIRSRLDGEGSLSLRRRVYLELLKLATAIERQGRLCHSFCFVGKR